MSFDERIALELDALDHLGTVESPVSERQIITFPKLLTDSGGDEEDDNHCNAFDVQQTENIDHRRVMDCDEVRIMIKVLGTKVCVEYFVILFIDINLINLFFDYNRCLPNSVCTS